MLVKKKGSTWGLFIFRGILLKMILLQGKSVEFLFDFAVAVTVVDLVVLPLWEIRVQI